jgi:hypothetical protein
MFDEAKFHGDTWYLQTDLIESEYEKIGLGEELTIKEQKSNEKEVSGKAGTGHLLGAFVKAEGGGGFKTESTAVEERKIKKGAFNKLLELVKQYEKEGRVIDLTATKPPSDIKKLKGAYICFDGEAKLEEVKKRHGNDQKGSVAVKGRTASFNFFSRCSNNYFEEISSSNFYNWLDAGLEAWENPYWETFCFGYVRDVTLYQNLDCVQANLWYIGGSTGTIDHKFKEEGDEIAFKRLRGRS